MLLLIIASACLAGAAFVLDTGRDPPERERRLLVRRAARYGAVRTAAPRRAPLAP